MDKGERREAKRFKEQHGMRVSNRSVLLLVELSARPAKKKKKGKK